jgi:hypothetical protein
VSVVARRVAAIPTRTSVGTWQVIADLLAASGSAAHAELMAATNVAAMLIADEYTRDAAIVVTAASGPRVRIYTLHGDDAIDGDHTNETPLAAYPTDEADWDVSLPCADAELDSVNAALDTVPHVAARALTDDIDTAVTASASGAGSVVINLTELERP